MQHYVALFGLQHIFDGSSARYYVVGLKIVLNMLSKTVTREMQMIYKQWLFATFGIIQMPKHVPKYVYLCSYRCNYITNWNIWKN